MRKDFYKTKEWNKARKLALVKAGYKCNRCSNAGKYVHHIEYLTDTNYQDVNISLSLDNLEVLCLDCHNREHFAQTLRQGLKFNEQGDIVEVL